MSPFVGGPLHSGLPCERVEGNGFPPSLPPSCPISTASRLFGAKLLHSRPVACFPPVLFPFHLHTKLEGSALNTSCRSQQHNNTVTTTKAKPGCIIQLKFVLHCGICCISAVSLSIRCHTYTSLVQLIPQPTGPSACCRLLQVTVLLSYHAWVEAKVISFVLAPSTSVLPTAYAAAGWCWVSPLGGYHLNHSPLDLALPLTTHNHLKPVHDCLPTHLMLQPVIRTNPLSHPSRCKMRAHADSEGAQMQKRFD